MMQTPLWTALITPFDSHGNIHFEDLESISRLQDDAGIGILLLGSTGEGLALEDTEKEQIIESVLNLGLNVPIMAGVGGFNLKKQVEWVHHLNHSDVDCLLLVNPLYAKPGKHGQIEWFTELLDAAEKPCMLYNIPSRTGCNLIPEALSELQNHPRLWAVKEASGSLDDYDRLRRAAPTIQFFSGDDSLMPFFAVRGCSGLVSVASNVWPLETRFYMMKSKDHETETLFPVWRDAIKALFSSSNPVPVKVLMKQKAMIETSVLRPPLTDNDHPDLEALLASDKAIKDWYNKS